MSSKQGGALVFDKANFIINIVILIILFRVCIDSFYSGEKPIVIVLLYTAFVYFTSLYLLLSAQYAVARYKLILLTLVFISLAVSLLYTDVPARDHIVEALKIFTPIIFLISATSHPELMKRVSIKFRKYFLLIAFVIVILGVLKYFVDNNQYGLGLYDFYKNNPNHVLAQVILKLSLISLSFGFFAGLFSLALIFFINVRSALLSYVISTFLYSKKYWKTKNFKNKSYVLGVPIIILAAVFVDFNDLFIRVVLKGSEGGDFVTRASSGRNAIYMYYIQNVLADFSFYEWFFGAGPIWLSSTGPELSAHNDILNTIVSYGILGFLLISCCYYYYYRSMRLESKSLFFASFTVLFLTNGVLFHQSNILFVLLYYYWGRSEK
ncbi:MAG: hypothetical protein ACI978_001969 [Oleispira sp.]